MENKKIRILRIITRLNIGGPAIHAVLLTRDLNDTEFESRLISGAVSKNEGDMGYITPSYNVKPVYISSLKREIHPFSDLMACYRIFKYVRRYKPDIVHTHTAKAGTLGRIAAILANVPVRVHTFHGHVFHGYFSTSSTQFFIFIERMLAKFTDAIIAISKGQKEEIVEKYKITNPESCHIIRLGFDLEKFLNSAHKKDVFRKRFNFKEDDILVGIAGRLIPIKNHKMFIDAAGHINKNAGKNIIDKIKFVIVGDGEMKKELLAYSRFKGLQKKIFFTGWVKDIDEVYAGLDIVALTSINEGTPVSLIEAMSSSKPVASTNVGGVKDAVGDIGVLVDIRDHERMADKILELARSGEKREKLGRLGRDFVRNNYSKGRLIFELKELYRDLLSKKLTGKEK